MEMSKLIGLGIAGFGAYWLYNKYATPLAATTTTGTPTGTTPSTTGTPATTPTGNQGTTTQPIGVAKSPGGVTMPSIFTTPLAGSVADKYYLGTTPTVLQMVVGGMVYLTGMTNGNADQWNNVYSQLSGVSQTTDVWLKINPNDRNQVVTAAEYMAARTASGLQGIMNGLGQLFHTDWNSVFSSRKGLGVIVDESDMITQVVPGSDLSVLDQTAPGGTGYTHNTWPRNPNAGNSSLRGIGPNASERISQNINPYLA